MSMTLRGARAAVSARFVETVLLPSPTLGLVMRSACPGSGRNFSARRRARNASEAGPVGSMT